MNVSRVQFVLWFQMLFALQASAATLYVDANSPGPAAPYSSLATAAYDIQTAVNAANPGDEILVNDGFYSTGSTATKGLGVGLESTYDTNRVVITKAITVQSIDGPGAAYIDGGGQFRCVYVTNGAVLSGFTLQNGRAGWTYTTTLLGHSTTKTNLSYGGGVSGTSLGLVTNCIVSGNYTYGYGGGAAEVRLINCTLQYNSALSGGGAYVCSMTNCVIIGNNGMATSKPPNGPQYPSTLQSAVGGGIYRGWIYNCLIENNSAFGGGGAYGADALVNCTIVNNTSTSAGGVDNVILQGGYTFSAYYNCIVYGNTASGTNSNYGTGSLAFSHSFVTPHPSTGVGNYTDDPQFMNSGGDFHLQATSPCINSGLNSANPTANDLDGNPRIVGATVDAGCYEVTNPTSMLGFEWAAQYGFPTDGSADFADPDGDGMNNWQEFVAGTNPTNAASVLAMTSASPPSSYNNWALISWQGVSTRDYYLQRSTNLSSGFSTISSNIVGFDGPNLIYDTTATNGASYFYRIGVQY